MQHPDLPIVTIRDSAPTRKEGPRQFYFTPGYACNSDCIMCGVAKWKRDSKQQFTLDEAKALIDAMALLSDDVLEFSGGEPTIYKGFCELVRYAKETYKWSYCQMLCSEDVNQAAVSCWRIPSLKDRPSRMWVICW